VLAVRGSDIDFENMISQGDTLQKIFGPFPSGPQLREALRLIRRIFPFFDTPKPVGAVSKHGRARIEFNTQIGQYPRDIDRKEYAKTIRRVELFLSGKGKELRKHLEREMAAAARDERFEDAAARRRELFALDHIQDVSLIKDAASESSAARIEAYDTAHLAGTNAIGVMVVVQEGRPVKKEYRTFRIKGVKKNDDVGSLREILSRRLNHLEWELPEVMVIDGGKAQRHAADEVLKEHGLSIPVVGVVKDERHRPREVVGASRAGISEADAVLANAEAHRFSLARHRHARTQALHPK
jgi:excinuclease ABC subunit C